MSLADYVGLVVFIAVNFFIVLRVLRRLEKSLDEIKKSIERHRS